MSLPAPPKTISACDWPTAFDFPADLDGEENLTLLADGSVLLSNALGENVYEVPAPWAYDAEGNEVPSWYTISGDTLTLNVDHSAVEAYPVVADPWYKPWTWSWNGIKDGAAKAWDVAQCVSAITIVVGSLYFAGPRVVRAVRAFRTWANIMGGYSNAVRIIMEVSTVKARIDLVVGAAGTIAAEVFLIDRIADKCL